MPSKTLTGCLMAMLLSGCQAPGVVTDSGCLWAGPIYVSRADYLTDGTARQVLAHNETWAKVCRH